MIVKMWTVAGSIVVCALSGAAAQSGDPKFPVESVPRPAGTGMPNGKPVDIRGLYAGMKSDEAVAVLREHYKTTPGNKLSVRMKTLRYASAPFVAYAANAGFGESQYYDYVGAAFTSNANGNQVVAIASEAKYQPGKEANAAQTLEAIRKKYGEPSGQDSGGTLVYAYKDGQVASDATLCSGYHRTDVSLVDADIVINDGWSARMLNAVQGDTPGPETGKCQAVMYVYLGYADYAGQRNKNAIARLRIAFFDAARFRAAYVRDFAVQKELSDKARGAAPSGSGASKL